MADTKPPDPIPRLAEKDYQDYEFILSEIERLVKLSPQEQFDRLREDPWNSFSGLNLANGSQLPLSREGQKRFSQMAIRGLKRLGEQAQNHRADRVVEKLKQEFLSHLLSGFEMSPENAHDLFSATINKLTEGYTEVTYYVPCSVVAERNPASFSLGPVSFQLREQFFRENEAGIRQAATFGENPQLTEIMLARADAFYSDFQWIASITIAPCDSEVSTRRAHALIQKALDVFKLLVGSDRASHVKQGYDLTVPSD